MSIKPVKKFKIRLKNQSWNIFCYRKSAFRKLYGPILGITIYDHKTNCREIHFPYNCKTSKDTIAHELLHAYCSYHNFSRRHHPDTIEEKICEIFGKAYLHMFKLIRRIYKEVNANV